MEPKPLWHWVLIEENVVIKLKQVVIVTEMDLILASTGEALAWPGNNTIEKEALQNSLQASGIAKRPLK